MVDARQLPQDYPPAQHVLRDLRIWSEAGEASPCAGFPSRPRSAARARACSAGALAVLVQTWSAGARRRRAARGRAEAAIATSDLRIHWLQPGAKLTASPYIGPSAGSRGGISVALLDFAAEASAAALLGAGVATRDLAVHLRGAFDDSAALWRRPIAGACEALRALAAEGLRLGVVSNAEGTAEARLAELAICQVGAGAGVRVEVVIDSHVVGVEKPDPAIFGHALRAMVLDPARCVYVGDSVTIDVAGASKAGLLPVLLDPYGEAETSAARVRSLADLLGRLSAGSPPR